MSEIATGATGAWSYRAGAWFAVFGSKTTVLLPESQKDQVVALWALVDGGAGFDDVLDGLLASGLSRIPGFVLVSTDEGPTRILLRGQGVQASLTGDGDDVLLDGAASHTWVERSVEGVTALSVTLPDAAEAEVGGVVLDFPIVTGLVRIGRIDRPPVAVAAAAADVAADESMSGESMSGVSMSAESDDAAVAGAVVPVVVAEDAAVDDMITEPDAEPDAEPVASMVGEPASEETVEGPPEVAFEPPVDAPAVDAGLPDVPAVVIPPPPVPSLGGAHIAPPDAAPLEEGSELEAPAAMAETSEDAMVEEAAPFDEEPVTEMMETGPDPLTDPLDAPVEEASPAEPADQPDRAAPEGWVTPWDTPPAPAPAADEAVTPDAEHPLAEPDTPAVPSPAFPPVSGATEIAPAGWAPPPPPLDQPGVVPPPPLPIGSWEPVGGAVPPPPAGFGADHDGLTVAGTGDEPAVPVAGIPGQPQQPAVTPPVAQLVFSDGQNVVVDRAVLIGRAPEARRFTSTEQPTLITVPSRLHEISSTHVEVRPGTGADHGSAVVTDMGSTNGTVLVQPGLAPEDLKPGIAVQLIPGAVINLGDGITIQVTRP